MERRYTLALGTDGNDLSLPVGQIAGIAIDNPSGSWLRITGVEEFVPPYTLGWGIPVSPTQLTVDVLFVDSPSGAPSDLIGSPVTVVVSNYPVPRNAGTLSGDPHTGRPGQATVQFTVKSPALAVEAGFANQLVPAVAGTSIVPLRIYMSASDPVNGAPTRMLKGLVSMWVGAAGGIPHMSVSPASPFAMAECVPGFRLPVSADLGVFLYCDVGLGEQYVDISTFYYRINET